MLNFKHKISTALVSIAVVLFSWWGVVSYMPHPLGDGMAYLGKEEHGNILGFDSLPYSVYYYGTNLSKDEVQAQFDAYADDRTSEVADDGYAGITTTFHPESGETFQVTYYNDGKKAFSGNTKDYDKTQKHLK